MVPEHTASEGLTPETKSSQHKITPCLWFKSEALEAAQFYTATFPNSSIGHVHRSTVDYPGGKPGSVLMVAFTLAGQRYQALNGGPHDTFNDAISLSVSCDDQAEVDHLWTALTADGGKPVQCGWLKDKYGLSWQIVPAIMAEMMGSGDPVKLNRVMAAVMQMTKPDIAALQRAFDGR